MRVLYLAVSPDGQVLHIVSFKAFYKHLQTTCKDKRFHIYYICHCLKKKENFLLQTIVTGAGDETLRFWNVFPSMKTVSVTIADPITIW